RISASTRHTRNNYLRDRAACAELLMKLDQDFSRIFARLEMSGSDERMLTELVSTFSQELLKLLDGGEETQQAMEDLGSRLAQLAWEK
ncbi:hypothetical protein JZU56_03075, partial [bacterium]|nr:hypothetical protein [bacterium]